MAEISKSEALDLAWGVGAIFKEINRDRRGTYYLLERGLLPGAFKIGGSWVLDRKVLRASFRRSSEAA